MRKTLFTIVGGSGAGKSTVTNRLIQNHSDDFHVIRLEDFYLPFDRITTRYKGRPNLDVIEAFDIEALQATLNAWSCDDSLPDSAILEGFIALKALPRACAFDTRSIYLEAPHHLRFARRQGEMKDPDYEKNVLIPMHASHVETQKLQADVIIDVAAKTAAEVEGEVFNYIRSTLREVSHA